MVAAFRNAAPNLYASPPVILNPDFPVPLMTYAEVQFIISEYKGFSEDEYKEGVKASLKYWASLDGLSIDNVDEYLDDVDEYVEAVSGNINAETVALQKYIDLYMNGMEAWSEIRRTGYPTQLLSPDEISVIADDGTELRFTTLSDTKGIIISRVKYPTNESTLNKPSFDEAVKKLEDGTNNYYTPMFWDKRRTEGAHPANK
jgi:hypothetical protein